MNRNNFESFFVIIILLMSLKFSKNTTQKSYNHKTIISIYED